MPGFHRKKQFLSLASSPNGIYLGLLHRLRSLVAPTLCAGFVAAAVAGWHRAGLESQAHAEPRRITPQDPDQHFKSGGRMSEAVLQEILAVLKRMDERLERIEKSADQLSTGARAPVAREADGPSTGSTTLQVRRN